VTGQNVLPACLKQVVEREDDALEVGPGALEDVERLGAGSDQQVELFGPGAAGRQQVGIDAHPGQLEQVVAHGCGAFGVTAAGAGRACRHPDVGGLHLAVFGHACGRAGGHTGGEGGASCREPHALQQLPSIQFLGRHNRCSFHIGLDKRAELRLTMK